LLDWLDRLGLSEYAEAFLEQGFDDLESLKEQMKSPMPLTHETLRQAGIKLSGHRARIIVQLEYGKQWRDIKLFCRCWHFGQK